MILNNRPWLLRRYPESVSWKCFNGHLSFDCVREKIVEKDITITPEVEVRFHVGKLLMMVCLRFDNVNSYCNT